ncbi:MAG: polyamine aminopropyltransferase [Candidatus Aminicenantes bacterium]|nr:polyamine aminopropyltransferase [Candidatus Aminicenantes bacterium]
MIKDGPYFHEPFTEDLVRLFFMDEIVYEGQTKYQLVHIFANKVFGKMLFLDKKVQSAQVDEFIFHECLVHPAMLLHPEPKKILILGGGEGATLREALKHPMVQRAIMVDIDQELVDLCRQYLPEWSKGAFDDSRSKLYFQDARRFVEKSRDHFDVIISDLTEPLEGGPSVYLFTREFFTRVAEILSDDGVFVLQAGSADPFYHCFMAACARTLAEVFPVVRPYWTFIFSFSLPWGFVLAAKKYDPLSLSNDEISQRFRQRGLTRLGYLHPQFFPSLFVLPRYLLLGLKKGDVLTDEKPFIWKA